jgi:RNA polymerase sigma-70 factor (ECF subfamily)
MAAYLPHDPPDEVLMLRLRQGDESALSELMVRWELPLKRFLYRLLLDTHEAAELAQESFVRLYFQRDKFREGAAFAPWMLTIAANLARNRRRWWRRHPTTSIDAANEETGRAEWEPADPSASPSDQVLAAERAAAVRSAVAALPHELREVVVLAEFEHKPQAEIAAVLGCTAKAVEMRLYRAREHLRRTLRSLQPALQVVR